MGPSKLCQCGYISNLREWVGRRLQEQHTGSGSDGLPPCIEISQRNKGCRQAETRQHIVEQGDSGTKQTARRNNMIASLE